MLKQSQFSKLLKKNEISKNEIKLKCLYESTNIKYLMLNIFVKNYVSYYTINGYNNNN